MPLHDSKLGDTYIGTDSRHVSNKVLESAVIKLQNYTPDELTGQEKTAVIGLKSPTAEKNTSASSKNAVLTMQERIAKRKKILHIPNIYMPSNFLLGSVAEVERVSSIMKYYLHGDIRNCLTPLLLEAFMFLRFNDRFWDAERVARAIVYARTERAKERVDQIQAELTRAKEDSDSE